MEIRDARRSGALSRISIGPRSWIVVLGLVVFTLAPVTDYLRLYVDNPLRPSLRSKATLSVLAKMAAAVPAYYLDKVRSAPRIEALALSIRPDHLGKLSDQRAEALRVGVLFASRKDRVPATLQVGGHRVEVRVRLKGDLSDHWAHDRWSLRVETEDGRRVLGLRRFSLHPPWARGFHTEPLFFDWLRAEGMLAPRADFVDFTLNGRHLGLMEIEEHPSAEMLSFHGRPSGVLFKLDESRLWREWVRAARRQGVRWSPRVLKPAAADDWRFAPIDPFEGSTLRASASLSRDLDRVSRRLAGLRAGELVPSAVFDAESWGRFLAHCEIFGAPHMALWNNLRFYADPATGLIEPVAFDTAVMPERDHRLRGRVVSFSCFGGDLELTKTMMDDPVMREAFLRALRDLDHKIHSAAAAAFFREREERYLQVLRLEYPWLGSWNLAAARKRAAALRAISEKSFEDHVHPPRRLRY